MLDCRKGLFGAGALGAARARARASTSVEWRTTTPADAGFAPDFATVLRLVRAGGLGFALVTTMKMFNSHETAACILVIIVLVSAADWISARLQKMML